jgi:hypothetical protein
MTIYLISGAVLFIAGVFFFAYRQGKKMADLNALIEGNVKHNEVKKKIKEINAKYKKEIRGLTRDRVLRFWGLRNNGSKKP